jgi:hypothetical protein
MDSEKVTVYRARDITWKAPLVRMQVDRVSAHSVWLGSSRLGRLSEGTRICDSFEEAKQWLQGELERQIEMYESKVNSLKRRLRDAMSATEQSIQEDNSTY